jgi:hypothetical protein
MRRFLEWMKADGVAFFLLFAVYTGALTDSLLKTAIGGVVGCVLSYCVVQIMERREKKLTEPYLSQLRRIAEDYRELRAFASKIAERCAPDLRGPQTITLSEMEIDDLRETLKTEW